MFVRKKKNKSGIVSVQIIDKSSGSYKVLKTIGSSSKPKVIEILYNEGKNWIQTRTKTSELDFTGKKSQINELLSQVKQIDISGTDLLLGKLFDAIGFNLIPDEYFRNLVLGRLVFPGSKLKTVDLLSKYQSKEISLRGVYRYLDKLYYKQKELIQQISYEHTVSVLGGKVSVVFYDVTTIYFQIDNEDDIRKRGFSKEGRHQNPQIVLGLLVSKGGYPLAYEIFEGNKFEGHTMLPVINTFKEKYQLKKLVIVADSGLLSKNNIKELDEKGYEYILGARIKSEQKEIKEQILALELVNGESVVLSKGNELSLIISYSLQRAKKDKHNRERGLKRLKAQLKSGKLTKAHINRRGYNKYLVMDGNVKLSINEKAFEDDAKWDGLKGYITNTKLTKEEIIDNYGQLWKIEKAFRVTKHDLKIRPIYHQLKRRIEAHVAINFAAYKIYKELERQLKHKGSRLSPERAIEIAKTIYRITIKIPNSSDLVSKTLILTEEQRNLADLFDFD